MDFLGDFFSIYYGIKNLKTSINLPKYMLTSGWMHGIVG
jgi:hypothetical protein